MELDAKQIKMPKPKAKQVKVEEKTKVKAKLPSRAYSRLVVLQEALAKHKVPFDKDVDLSTLKIDGQKFEDLISSRPLIGSTTKKGLLAAGIKCIPIKMTTSNRIQVVKFEKAK